MNSRRWQILALLAMALIGIAFGFWLVRRDFAFIGSLCIAVFLWRTQQSVLWFISPAKAPSIATPAIKSRWQRLLFSFICLAGATISATGVYLWRLWPEERQAGLVFVLFGLIVLIPITLNEIRSRQNALR